MLARQNLIVVASKLTIHPVDGAKPPECYMLYRLVYSSIVYIYIYTDEDRWMYDIQNRTLHNVTT